jgi:hypothetical protein
MKRTAIALAIILALLISAAAGMQFITLGKANPSAVIGSVPPDEYTKPPEVSISSPNNGTWIAENSVNLTCRVNVGESKTAWSRLINEVYYEADWQQNKTYIFGPIGDMYYYPSGNSSTIDCNLSLTGVPEGKHNITVHAVEYGAYNPPYVSTFSIKASSSICFTVDTTLQTIIVHSPLTWVAAAIVSVAVVGAGLFIFFKKWHRQLEIFVTSAFRGGSRKK